jgi:hypothetical protein
MRAREQVARWNRPFLADRIPYPRHWRKVGGPGWSVPLVEVVVAVADEPLERVRAAVDAVLRGTEHDVRVSLVGRWEDLGAGRVSVLTDPASDRHLIAATYRGEPRVRLVAERPVSAFPAPFLLDLPPACGLAVDSLRRLIDLADRHQVGVVRVNTPGAPVVLWRTAALGRACWVRSGGESWLDLVSSVYGARDVPPAALGVVDLAAFEPSELARGAAVPTRTGRRATGWAPTTVEVEGMRSWARATVVVAWLVGRRLTAWLRNYARRPRTRSRTRRRSAGGSSQI